MSALANGAVIRRGKKPRPVSAERLGVRQRRERVGPSSDCTGL